MTSVADCRAGICSSACWAALHSFHMPPSHPSGECALLLILTTMTECPWNASLLPLGHVLDEVLFLTCSLCWCVLFSYCLVKAVTALAIALARQDLSCTYLADHELECVVIIIITGASRFVLADSGELSRDREYRL